MDGFTLIAEPTRRQIIDRLRVAESDVNGLVAALGLPQPVVSKHLRVLRDAGVVRSTVAGNRRIYRLGLDPLPDVLRWVRPYYDRWSAGLDRLEESLRAESNPEEPR